LPLKMGAQVLLTKNMPEMRLVNGSRGIVLGFRETLCDGYGVPPSTYTWCVARCRAAPSCARCVARVRSRA
jgi:hypothetical protein